MCVCVCVCDTCRLTDFVVRPSTGDEKGEFQQQEAIRYANAHRSFTYCMHGYRSVVGPVKVRPCYGSGLNTEYITAVIVYYCCDGISHTRFF